jgi:DNA-binding LacI/PurR family transcriptional regulator
VPVATASPLYKRIKEQIRADLVGSQTNGELVRLPAERELQARYGVSRPTISKALAELAAEGLVARSPGSGSFLLPRQGAAGAAARRIGYVAPIPGHELTQRSLRGIERTARRRGYRVIFGNAGLHLADEQAAVQDLIAAGVCGLVISPVTRSEAELADDYLRSEALGVPAMLIDTALPEHPHPKVLFDNWRAAYEMTRWLFRRGHRRIAVLFFTERLHHATLRPRCEGYQDALRDLEIVPDAELVGRYELDRLAEQLPSILEEWLGLPEPPTAILAAEDVCAMETIEALLLRGVRVPEQVQVVGFDHLEVARRFRPAFPTTNPDFVRMGEIACDLLLRAVETGEAPPEVYMLEVPLATHRHPAGAPTAGALPTAPSAEAVLARAT